MITAANLQSAIKRVDARLLTGQRGFALIENLPRIAAVLSIMMGECCADCNATLRENESVLRDGRILCLKCGIVAAANDDIAEPSEPFQGSGVRVVRKTGGLT